MPNTIPIEYDESLKELENLESEKDNYDELPPLDIVAYNELRSCADIKRMYDSRQLIIKPDFQREFVWNRPAQTRFIDSLIKQLPIPSMCFSLDYKTNERLVIDGLQRIQTIITFLSDETWTLSELDDIDPRISGKTVSALKIKNLDMYERVENLTIPITVIRCDYSKKSHNEYLFTIFHRLNTGGTKLNNQEIRNCIYGGTFNELLKELVLYPNFRKILQLKDDETYRFNYEELLLRFFAFFDNYKDYNGKLSKYLNDYIQKRRNIDQVEVLQKKEIFNRTIDLISNKILENDILPSLSKATIEGLFIGISKNIDALESKTTEELKSAFTEFRNDINYSVENLKEGLSAKGKVILRLESAIRIFTI